MTSNEAGSRMAGSRRELLDYLPEIPSGIRLKMSSRGGLECYDDRVVAWY
jgi:hypothetical protein